MSSTSKGVGGGDPFAAALVGMLRPLMEDVLASAIEQIVGCSKPDKLWNTAEVAEYLGITTRTVQSLREQGMPWRRVGDSARYARFEIDEWSRARTKVPNK
jgi:excisionase family DNA binding protein